MPALANIFETSIDLLVGMDTIRAETTRYNIHKQAIDLLESGLPISINEKQKSTMRATLCFLYLKAGYEDKANRLASELPHTRESREIIQPLIQRGLTESEINENIKIFYSVMEKVYGKKVPLKYQ